MTDNRILRLIYKTLALGLLSYALLYGLLATLPRVGELGQSSRNLFYHVPMWFAMYLVMGVSLFYTLWYLRSQNPVHDIKARSAAQAGILFGCMGLITGIVWSRVTWGALYADDNPVAWWSWDPKQTLALSAVLMSISYFILRANIEEPVRRAKVAAVYNVFAAVSLVPLTLIIPRMLGGLHPGSGESDNIFAKDGMSSEYRMIFYPAILGFMLLALWVVELRARAAIIEHKLEEISDASTL